jgi:short-subunit dehydrogenase
MTNLGTPRTALVTGASAGIGWQLAHLFAADGFDLVLVARRRDRLEELAGVLQKRFRTKAELIDADLRDPTSAARIVSQLESRELRVDALVNNAGFGRLGSFADHDLTAALDMIAVNVQAVVQLTRLLLPNMLLRRQGHIINIGSVAGFLPGPYMAVYYATKAFVNSFGEALAEELRGTGVSVTTCCPGPTATEFGTVAGSADRRVIKANSMPASTVAKHAYRAMQREQVLAIPGISNRFLVSLLRLMPRASIRRIAGRMNRLAHD